MKQFFAKISTIESLCDQETRDWLGSLPHHMRREVIPLFESSIDGVFEDYQLYPSYCWLTKGKIATNPDLDFYHLSCVENTEPQMGGLFMPLGRLFVNADNGNHFNERCNSNRSRLTRWTGYEVFISNDMAIWIVFDGHSFASHARPWYPVSCGITEPFEPGIARLLPSLSELEHATFENAMTSIKATHLAGEMHIYEVEKSEVKGNERNQEEIPAQDAVLTGKGKQRADDTARANAAQTLPSSLSTTPSDTLGTS